MINVMSIIELLKRTALYRWYHQRNVKRANEVLAIRNRYFLQEGEEVLHVFSKALNANDIVFWLEFGSLLGYYREHDFIKHDCDIDFGVFLKDADIVRKSLEDVGFKLIHQYRSSDGGLEECYKFKHTSIDVFYFREDSNVLYCNTFISRYPIWLNKILRSDKCLVKRINIPNQAMVKAKYKGTYIYVPVDCANHLEMHYGKSFMTPNPNFDYKKEATNITYYEYRECKGLMRIFGEKI